MKRDDEAMNAILRLPTDMQVWEMQQGRSKSVFKSASLTLGQNPHLNNFCQRCNGNGHLVGECPWSNANLVADRE